MRESDIRQVLNRRIDELLPDGGLRWAAGLAGKRGEDGAAEIKVKGRSLSALVGIVGQPNLARLSERCQDLIARSRRSRRIPLLVAPYLNSEMRARCRESGVRYLDLSGNVWIETPAILVEKQAAKNLYPHEAKHRSPFADRASLIFRFLSVESGPATLGQIASATGLDSGYVSRIVRAAVELRYAMAQDDGRVRLINQEEMLNDWASVYTWRKNDIATYFLKGTTDGLPDLLRRVLSGRGKRRYALTLHGGNNQVAPFVAYNIWHLYVEKGDLGQEIAEGLRLESVPEDSGNVVLLTPHYRSSVFFNARSLDGLEVVSDLQLYLDLRHYPVRGVEASEEILARRLRPAWRAP